MLIDSQGWTFACWKMVQLDYAMHSMHSMHMPLPCMAYAYMPKVQLYHIMPHDYDDDYGSQSLVQRLPILIK